MVLHTFSFSENLGICLGMRKKNLAEEVAPSYTIPISPDSGDLKSDKLSPLTNSNAAG